MKFVIGKYKWPILYFTYGLVTFPFYYNTLSNGLDSSWAYLLNKLSLTRFKYGRYIVLTFGPLGFFEGPMNINGRIWPALFYLAFVFISQVWFFSKLSQKRGLRICIIFTVILFLANPASLSDHYMLYCFFMTLAMYWEGIDDKYTLVVLTILSGVGFLEKFTISMVTFVTLIVFSVVMTVLKQYKSLWKFLFPLFSGPVFYLIYNPSLTDLKWYIRGGLEISSGYSSGMSVDAYDSYVPWIVIMMIIYIIMFIYLLFLKELRNAGLLLWMGPNLFMLYKHGFVRADGHWMTGYLGIVAFFALLIFLFDYSRMEEALIGDTDKKGIILG